MKPAVLQCWQTSMHIDRIIIQLNGIPFKVTACVSLSLYISFCYANSLSVVESGTVIIVQWAPSMQNNSSLFEDISSNESLCTLHLNLIIIVSFSYHDNYSTETSNTVFLSKHSAVYILQTSLMADVVQWLKLKVRYMSDRGVFNMVGFILNFNLFIVPWHHVIVFEVLLLVENYIYILQTSPTCLQQYSPPFFLAVIVPVVSHDHKKWCIAMWAPIQLVSKFTTAVVFLVRTVWFFYSTPKSNFSRGPEVWPKLSNAADSKGTLCWIVALTEKRADTTIDRAIITKGEKTDRQNEGGTRVIRDHTGNGKLPYKNSLIELFCLLLCWSPLCNVK